jgi:hypothetical protein
MIGVSEEANELIRDRAENGKFVPRAGQMAFCQHGILGFVEDAVVRDGELLFRGRRVADPFKNWQSKNPVQYKDGSDEERKNCETDFSHDAGT